MRANFHENRFNWQAISNSVGRPRTCSNFLFTRILQARSLFPIFYADLAIFTFAKPNKTDNLANCAEKNLRGYLPLLPPVEASHLRPVPAFRHVAPTPSVVLAFVQKQPITIFRRARSHKFESIGRQQLRRRARYRPQGRIQLIRRRVELPLEMSVARDQTRMPRRILDVPVQHAQRCLGHSFFLRPRPKHVMHRLPHSNCIPQNSPRLLRILHAPRNQVIALPLFEDPSLLRESRQVAITRQQFFRLFAETVVQRVDEVQAHYSRNQLKLWRPSFIFLCRNSQLETFTPIM